MATKLNDSQKELNECRKVLLKAVQPGTVKKAELEQLLSKFTIPFDRAFPANRGQSKTATRKDVARQNATRKNAHYLFHLWGTLAHFYAVCDAGQLKSGVTVKKKHLTKAFAIIKDDCKWRDDDKGQRGYICPRNLD